MHDWEYAAMSALKQFAADKHRGVGEVEAQVFSEQACHSHAVALR